MADNSKPATPTPAAAAPPTPAGQRIAAIDVGSNSIRLVVAEVLPSGGYRVLDEERENTRLAAALAKTDCPMSCPHGRPVVLRYSVKEIERAFHRI